MTGSTEAEVMASEREMLVGFCARYTGNLDAAEDLAQQTLFEAWRHEQQLRNPQARKSWLLSIARNECLRWARHCSRERSRSIERERADELEAGERLAGDCEVELELERDELASLLDRAMALLPPDTREVLIRRYIEESPQAEVARRLGLTEGAVEAKLHRGKLALKRVLTTELSEEAMSYGLVLSSDAGWQETRVWCPGCGTRRLEGWLRPEEGRLQMRCRGCAFPYDYYINAHQDSGLRGAKTFKPAVSRVLNDIHHTYRIRTVRGVFACGRCGGSVPLMRSEELGVYLHCRACRWLDNETWHSLTWSLPEARQFWREHPRMRFLPEREVEVGGCRAVVTGFESLTEGARLEVVALRDTLEVLSVHGAPRLRDTRLPEHASPPDSEDA